jgi:hypothetical protein
MAFCTKCGETLQHGTMSPQPPQQGNAPQPPLGYAPQAPPAYVPPAAYAAPPVYAPYPTQPQVAPSGPPGSVREPWVVVVLAVVTLGIYALVYWWTTSKEMDAYIGKPGHSHKSVRLGVLLSLAALGIGIFVFIGFLSAMYSAGAFDTTMTEPNAAMIGAIFSFVGGFILVAGLGLAGVIFLYVGRYRMWEAIEAEERRRMWPSPLSAGLMLALSIAAYFVPFVGFVLPLVVLYMTQEHLNKLWATPTPWATQAAR